MKKEVLIKSLHIISVDGFTSSWDVELKWSGGAGWIVADSISFSALEGLTEVPELGIFAKFSSSGDQVKLGEIVAVSEGATTQEFAFDQPECTLHLRIELPGVTGYQLTCNLLQLFGP